MAKLGIGLFGGLEEQKTVDQRTRKILKLLFFQFTFPMFFFPSFQLPFSLLVWFHILQWKSRLQMCLGRSNADFFFEMTKTQWRSLKHREQMALLVFLACKHISLTAVFSVINLVIFLQWPYVSFSLLYLLPLGKDVLADEICIYWQMNLAL